MTLAVGLAESDSVARAKHLPALLLDAPAIPPPTLRLLRAMCRLPLPEGRETEYGFGSSTPRRAPRVGAGNRCPSRTTPRRSRWAR